MNADNRRCYKVVSGKDSTFVLAERFHYEELGNDAILTFHDERGPVARLTYSQQTPPQVFDVAAVHPSDDARGGLGGDPPGPFGGPSEPSTPEVDSEPVDTAFSPDEITRARARLAELRRLVRETQSVADTAGAGASVPIGRRARHDEWR